MKAGWRWFGPSDAISLQEIRQAGVTDVVTSLYEQPVGAVWPLARIRETAKACRDNGMTWSVVESVPVHEDVKKRTGNWRKYVENYKKNLRNLAKCGVKVVCYNFMPPSRGSARRLCHARLRPVRGLRVRDVRAEASGAGERLRRRHPRACEKGLGEGVRERPETYHARASSRPARHDGRRNARWAAPRAGGIRRHRRRHAQAAPLRLPQ